MKDVEQEIEYGIEMYKEDSKKTRTYYTLYSNDLHDKFRELVAHHPSYINRFLVCTYRVSNFIDEETLSKMNMDSIDTSQDIINLCDMYELNIKVEEK